VFVSFGGGSVGWQIGAQAADVVLIFATKRSVDHFEQGDFTLGGSASVTAGPVGRQTEAAAGKDSEVYAYSRTRGLFAGVSIDGTVLSFSKRSNRAFYGAGAINTDAITSGKVTTSSQTATRLLAAISALAQDTTPGSADVTQPAPMPAAAAAPASNTGTGTSTGSGARTFPMEDPKPGSEPN
jgi:lipid-binding SYLF domain-containing protein